MTTVDPSWSLESLLRDYRPHQGWRESFEHAYEGAMESRRVQDQLEGWRQAAMIFGDMRADVFCLFVCHHAQALFPVQAELLQAHIDICLLELGLAQSRRSRGAVFKVTDLGKQEAFSRDTDAARDWFADQLRPFTGDVALAASFAMRLTAVRLGMLRGPSDPSIDEVLDESLWQRVK